MVNIAQPCSDGKTDRLVDVALQLQQFAEHAAVEGRSLYTTEKTVLATVLKMGRLVNGAFLQHQGDGDLGPVVATDDGQELQRSDAPVRRPLRTVFGEHAFNAYVCTPGPKQETALRPIDARLNLPAGRSSYLLEEFSQYLCVEQAQDVSTCLRH